MMPIKLKCQKCGEIICVRNTDIKCEEFLESNDDARGNEVIIIVKSIVCPECKEKIYVQADTHQTLAMADEVVNLMVKKLKARKYGRTFHKKQSDKAKRINNDLEFFRKCLIESLEGKPMTNVFTRGIEVLHFTDYSLLQSVDI